MSGKSPIPFQLKRPRRLRTTAGLRRMVRETRLSPSDFIYPLFVTHHENAREPIATLPGIARLGTGEAVREAERALALGIPAVLLFGIPECKDNKGSEAYAERGAVQRAVRALRQALPELVIITDVCLCAYTDHGHCGLLPEGSDFVLNDETLPLLCRMACSHADAGADIVAPSGMMDGMVLALRAALDQAGHAYTSIMSYSVKYASAFYGPFRDAAGGAPKHGDRKSHQMDPANSREAGREAALDAAEGADFLMVKPALAYLDVIRRVKDGVSELPLAAYNVSGEYAMLKAAAASGTIDERAGTLEVLSSIRRAGADLIITYHAPDAARWLSEESSNQ